MKTKLGISAGLMGAAIYFTFLFGGYTPLLILAAYVFFKEDNAWLKKSVVKALALGICFSLITTAINLIPDAIGLLDSLTNLINKSFSISIISKLVRLLLSAVSFIRTILFLLLGLQALKMQDFPVGPVDKMVDEAFSSVSGENAE